MTQVQHSSQYSAFVSQDVLSVKDLKRGYSFEIAGKSMTSNVNYIMQIIKFVDV